MSREDGRRKTGFVQRVQAELNASPEARATFEKDLASYTAWLRAQRA